MATDRVHFTDPCGSIYSFMKSQHIGLHSVSQRLEFRKPTNGHFMGAKLRFSTWGTWDIYGKPYNYTVSREHAVLCLSTRTQNTEAKECVGCSEDCSDSSRGQIGDGVVEDLFESTYASQGLAEACKFVYNDAKYVNERARNDIVLLSRGIMRLNDRARQDFEILGLEFLKLDARAREDTEKIDHGVKKKAARLHDMAMILKDKAQSKLKRVADQHWSDGALEADLRRADFCVRRRAMEDAFMALEFVRNIHDMMVRKTYKLYVLIAAASFNYFVYFLDDLKWISQPHVNDLLLDALSCRPKRNGRVSVNDMMSLITLEKNGKALDFFPGEVSTDRITAIQEAYWSMASALSEADGIDYTDPEELELLVATLIDLDAMDGKSSVSLLAECSSSPDVNTRTVIHQAFLGEARVARFDPWLVQGGALKASSCQCIGSSSIHVDSRECRHGGITGNRLAEDSNPAVAAAASKAIDELKRQWEIEEGDSWRFTMNNQMQMEESDSKEDNDDTDNLPMG
ncbi:senescence-associated family protein [Cinnamomum micranthum f. kanehirae]|uniref:Senescence-associated family protein n=1 Tax=Cinnamomum micranthum f. kanehirae TaxID=337451 RepID=A0A3S3MSV9_9MAGN|nr:senescence-associated family protein [Cinnamomum micranthum f. kanehirae]